MASSWPKASRQLIEDVMIELRRKLPSSISLRQNGAKESPVGSGDGAERWSRLGGRGDFIKLVILQFPDTTGRNVGATDRHLRMWRESPKRSSTKSTTCR